MPHRTPPPPMRRLGIGVTLIGCTGIPLSLPGCEMAAVPFAGFENYTVPAQYVLPARPTVIIVEPASRSIEDQRFARFVAARAQVQLADNLVSPPDAPAAQPTATHDAPGLSLIDAAEVVRYQDQQGAAYYAMAIDRLGRELGAEVVIYAKVANAKLNDQGAVLQPQARLMVRVVDARTGDRLWPQQHAGMEGDVTAWPISVGGVHQTTSAGELSGTTRDRAWRDLADSAGLELSRLFYEWQRPQPGAKAEAEKQRIQKQKRTNKAALP